MKDLNSLAGGTSLRIREPTEMLLLMEPIPWAGSKKEKVFTKLLSVMSVRKVTKSSCSLLELRMSFHLTSPTHLLFPVIATKIIWQLHCDLTTSTQTHLVLIAIKTVMHMPCLKNQWRRQSNVDNPAVWYHLSIYLFLEYVVETRTLLERVFLYYPQQLHKQFKPSKQDTVGVFGNQQICSGNNETFIMGFGVGKGLVGGGIFSFF